MGPKVTDNKDRNPWDKDKHPKQWENAERVIRLVDTLTKDKNAKPRDLDRRELHRPKH